MKTLFFIRIYICVLLFQIESIATEEEFSLSSPVPVELQTDINAKSLKTQILNEILNESVYDKSLRPTGINGSGPVVLAVNVRIPSVENLDDYQMEFKVQLNYRQHWIDPRLSFDHKYKNINFLQLSTPERTWRPDVVFGNEKDGKQHELMVPNTFSRIYPDGKIETSTRITLQLSCPMDLHFYPMDKQSCEIIMSSYGWTMNDLIVKWRSYRSVEVSPGIQMPRFRLISYSNHTCPIVMTSTGIYDCIKLVLRFEREFGYYLIQVYVPCIMLVIVSWVSFWLEPTAAEARISLGVTTILTVVTQAYGINQSVPPASYIKAIDVWTFTVQFMVFAAILQFSYVNYVARFEWKRAVKGLQVPTAELQDLTERLRIQGEKKAKRFDNISKILFPVFFAMFNLIYWFKYMGYDEEIYDKDSQPYVY